MTARTRHLLVGSLLLVMAVPGHVSAAAGDGIFASTCGFSHRGAHDPIVSPGRTFSEHSHDFFGNRTTDGQSTRRSLRRADSTCSRQGDTAAYWVPTLYRGGEAVRPRRASAYYAETLREQRVRPFPRGLKIVAGDAHARRPQPLHVVHWACDRAGAPTSSTVPRCGRSGVVLRVLFPDCWDGRRTDSRDHSRHMAYSRFDSGASVLRCPAAHPVAVPMLALNVEYPIPDGRGTVLASGAVSTAHADFFNAWRQRDLRRLTRRCLGADGRACAQRPRVRRFPAFLAELRATSRSR